MSIVVTAQDSSDPGILVVRLGSMGDVIHALPAVASLKRSFPEVPLAWAVEPRWACLLEGNPFVDRVILIDRREWASLRAAWQQIRSIAWKLAVDFQGLLKSALVILAARPDRSVGFHWTQLRERAAGLFYSTRVRTHCCHVVDRNLELATAAGAQSVVREFPLPEGTPEGDLPGGDFVLASPLAGWGGKQWPHGNYAELARMLDRRLSLPLVVNGPPEKRGLLEAIDGVRVHCSGLPGLIDATRRATAVVGVDSGPIHLAAALKKPGVAIYGPTDPARNGPYGNTLAVLRSPSARTSYKRRRQPDPAMAAIRPEEVFQALEKQLTTFQGSER